ncbi:MAG: STAS domain-containing protein [Planctomycetes bacterium]|nr:STAS domain-containing protein [Planctomycetota bacterium]
MASELKISRQDLDGGLALISLEGSLDSHTYGDLDEILQAYFDDDKFKIIVDVLKVDYISSAGVGVFVGAVSQAQEGGGDIVLLKATNKIKEIFDLLGLSSILNFEPELGSAKAHFG